MEDWAPDVRAFFESMQVEEKEDENSEEGEDLSEYEDDVHGGEEVVVDHYLSSSNSIEMEKEEEP